MSWSVSRAVGTGETIGERVNALQPLGVENPPQQVTEGIEAAKAGALALIESGAYGDPKDPEIGFSVNLSGHANPDHKPYEGWANDCVTVSVGQLTPKQLGEVEAQQKAAEQAAE